MIKDSAIEKWEYREHTKVKHILLEKYLAAWIPILGKWYSRICYFDGFAGRGEYRDEKTGELAALGSPIIALRVANGLLEQCEKKDKRAYFDEFICIAVEKNENNFISLQNILRQEKGRIKFKSNIRVEPKNDEFVNVSSEILDYQETAKSSVVPSFFFVDPFGFSGIPFAIIKRILSKPKTEVFFNFMVRDVARFIEHPQLRNTFTELFGTEEWKM